jgi:mannobiose 2-epimerase
MVQQSESPPLLRRMGSEMKSELLENILPFWLRYRDLERGGFYGHILNNGKRKENAPKGLVMQARFLWTYSAAYRLFKDPAYLAAARHAYDFLANALKDKEYGGFWWAVDAKGAPLTENKVIYGQAFALYGLSEFYRATKDAAAFEEAKHIYALIDAAARDRKLGGYYEACMRDWSAPLPAALSRVDIACVKSMNTNLHMLEALSAFKLAGGDCAEALASCLDVYLNRVVQDSGWLSLFFDEAWKPLSDHRSYGHEIESCWLSMEAAEILYGEKIAPRLRERALSMARECLISIKEFGGTLPNELHHRKLDADRVWWVQAETVVGFAEAFGLSGDAAYLDAAAGVWEFIKAHMIDRKNGDWFWAVTAKGRPIGRREKGGMWKANYHNARACMEIMRRAGVE